MQLRGILKVKTNEASFACYYDESKHPAKSYGSSKAVTFHAGSLCVYDSESQILTDSPSGSSSYKSSFTVVSKHYFPPIHNHNQLQKPERRKQHSSRAQHYHRTFVSQHCHNRFNHTGNITTRPLSKPNKQTRVLGTLALSPTPPSPQERHPLADQMKYGMRTEEIFSNASMRMKSLSRLKMQQVFSTF